MTQISRFDFFFKKNRTTFHGNRLLREISGLIFSET